MVLSDENKELDTVESTALIQCSDSDVSEREPQRISDVSAPEGVIIRSDEENILNTDVPTPLPLIQGSEVKLLEYDNSEAHSHALGSSNNLFLRDNLMEKGDPVRERDVLQIESEDKEAQLNRYLFHPQNAGQEELSIFAVRTRLPGESSFSLETGEPAKAPPKRPLSPASRAQAAYTRRHGACNKCRAQKKKCLHRLQERAIPSNDTEPTQGDMPIGNTRNRAAFDYPRRHRRPEIDNIAKSEHIVSENAGSMTLSRRKPSSIKSGTKRARRLPTSDISQTRANHGETSPVVASPHFEGTGTGRELSLIAVEPPFPWGVLPEHQIVTAVSPRTDDLHTDQSDFTLPIQSRSHDALRERVLATGELSRNPLITLRNQPHGAPVNVDQTVVSTENDLTHSLHEDRPSAAFPRMSQMRTRAFHTNTNDHDTSKSASSQAPSTSILTHTPQIGPSSSVLAISSEPHAVSSWDTECLQVEQFHTATEDEGTYDADYSQMHSAYMQSDPVTSPGQATSMAIAANFNVYGDFPWLDDGDIEKLCEMDMDLTWDDDPMFPSDSGFSFLESGDSTSGSGLTPPSEDSGRDPTT
ncbi:hypothetical protein MMC11_000889 [Xylographa trunciseda]|nr:hypothetical protein [Xylographa trunciseda]